MNKPLFRQQALDHIASQDRLYPSLQLVSKPRWLLLAVFGLVIVAGLAAALFIKVPMKLAGPGLLIDRSGLAEIVVADPGRIEQLLVAPGDRVSIGQPVAAVARPDLAREIVAARAKLADAQARYQRLRRFYGLQDGQLAGADALRLSTIAEARRALAERERFLVNKAQRMEALIGRGFIRGEELINVRINLADVRERLANLGETALRVGIDATKRKGETNLALLDEERIIDEQARTITRLSSQLGEQQIVRAAQAGVVTEIKVTVGDVVAAGTPLATISSSADALVALLYVPAAEGKRITPGMAAEIVPTTVKRAIYGHIPGKVIAVAPLQATAQGMRRVLRNDQLVQELTAGGAPIEVRVALDRDSSTASGFAWSASRGPQTIVSAGSPVNGRVVVDSTRLIQLVVLGVSE
jgi:HlyD family secretion protein